LLFKIDVIEGVSIPIIDSVCFVDVRTSTIDLIQCIGRALRLHSEKKKAYIIIPTFIKDFNEDFDNKKYGNLIRILKALKNTDEGIIEYFSTKDSKEECVRNVCKVECYVKKNMASINVSVAKWIDNIGTKLWNVVDSRSYKYEQVKAWIKKYNKIPNKRSKNKIELSFGTWTSFQKQQYDRLDKCRIKKLELIKNWYWKMDDPFYKKCKDLIQFVGKHNRLPKTSKNKDKNSLAEFVFRSRNSYKKK